MNSFLTQQSLLRGKSAFPIAVASLVLFCVGCGKSLPPAHLQAPPKVATNPVHSVVAPDVVTQPSACEYWSSTADATGGDFQLVSDLELRDHEVYGRYRLDRLPQVRYKMSAEYNKDKPLLEQQSITAFDKDQFHYLAESAYKAGKLELSDWLALQMAYSAGLWPRIILERNKKVTETIESKVPGAFGGPVAPVKNTGIMHVFLASVLGNESEVAAFDMAKNFDDLSILGQRSKLFSSPDWRVRREDLKKSLAVLEQKLPPNPSLRERACRFALTQRLTAQILQLKGFKGAPVLDNNGDLAPMPTEWNAPYPTRDEAGVFGMPADELWIAAKFQALAEAKKTQAPAPSVYEGASLPSFSDRINQVAYFVELSAHRTSSTLWDFQNTDNGLNPRFIALSMALFGVASPGVKSTLEAMAQNVAKEIYATSKTMPTPEQSLAQVIQQKLSTPELTSLGFLSLGIVQSFAAKPLSALQQQVLNQVLQLSDAQKDELKVAVESADSAIRGIDVVAALRASAGDPDAELVTCTRTLGAYLNNSLQNFSPAK